MKQVGRRRILSNKNRYKELFELGSRIENKYVRLYYLDAIDSEGCLGIVASKRIGNSVVRNRCKRLLRELFVMNGKHINIKKDFLADFMELSLDLWQTII